MCKFLFEYLFSILGDVIVEVELLGRHKTFLRNCQAVFQSSCTILHYYQQCVMFLISFMFSPNLDSSHFFIIIILVSINWYLIMVSSLHLPNDELLYLLVICVSWTNIYSSPLPIFKLGGLSFVFLLLSCMCSLYILGTGSLSDIDLEIFPPILLGCLSTFFVVFFVRVFNSGEVQFTYF